MTFDNSRFPFDPWKDYCGVVGLQGRVHLESEWNEWLAEMNRRSQAGTLDALGRVAVPSTTPDAFKITASAANGNHLSIGPGRIYVDGILAENHGDPKAAQWDPALAELSGSPQPPPATETAVVDYTSQPYLPGAALLPGNGPFLAYLDVWRRAVTYLEDPDLIDKAVGVDTTGRLQTVWQVKLLDLGGSSGITCSSSIPAWDTLTQPSAGQLTTGVVQSKPSGPCCLSPSTGYTGMENQFYRVQIHQPGLQVSSAVTPTTYPLPAGGSTATFKWSRDNGSVETGVTGIASVTNTAGNPASALTVLSMGRDNVLGFAPGNWIEITDDVQELYGLPGELHQIDSIDFAAKVIVLDSTVLSTSFPVTSGQTDPKRHTRITRWDQAGKVYESDGVTVWADLGASGSTGDIPVPPAGATLILENGITVTFNLNPANGTFHTADFWTFAARTADGSVEALTNAFPRGIHHHYARLSIVTFPKSATDCRPSAPTANECDCCCTCTVGDGMESFGQFTKIQDAINSLPAGGGEICILPGRYFENVKISQQTDIVIHGCGWRTRVASPSLAPIQLEAQAPAAAAANALSAVISIASSKHVELRSFVVEAGDGDIGILVDGDTAPAPSAPAVNVAKIEVLKQPGVIDTTIKEMVITASTRPAILARNTELLRINGNRIVMEDVRSTASAVYASGTELRIEQNWIGLLQSFDARLPAVVTSDFNNSASAVPDATNAGLNAKHPGGIHIGGLSEDVYILENEIEGGSRNGITLGSLEILDNKGKNTGRVAGVLVTLEDDCATTGTALVSGTNPGAGGGSIVSGGRLVNIQIHRNRIRNMGLCGIGPVGFFDLTETPEIITVEGLNISENGISNTLQRSTDPVAASQASFLGYGAISVADVDGLIIRDNTITDFGATPGLAVYGIFILHGEMIEISRNKIMDTRDWTRAVHKASPPNGGGGGIMVLLATPPSSSNPASAYVAAGVPPIFEPGLPALRVEHNMVRVPLGEALAAIGIGPFSIVNNHLSTGGNLRGTGTELAQTVLLMNLGNAIEAVGAASTPSGLFLRAKTSKVGSHSLVSNSLVDLSSGAVLFTNNICQLEARLSGQSAAASVFIFTLDHLTFANNHCWLDAANLDAFTDALLLAGTLNVVGNRFQEAPNFPVLLSGLTVGIFNITAQNISTYCLVAGGLFPIVNNNLSLADPTNASCSRLWEQLAGK